MMTIGQLKEVIKDMPDSCVFSVDVFTKDDIPVGDVDLNGDFTICKSLNSFIFEGNLIWTKKNLIDKLEKG